MARPRQTALSFGNLRAWTPPRRGTTAPDRKSSRKIGDKYATFRTFAVEGAEMK